jgi:hypothetical protein
MISCNDNHSLADMSMINHFIISIEIGAEFIFIISTVVHHLSGILMAGLCMCECIYFVPMISHLCCGVLEMTLYQLGANT